MLDAEWPIVASALPRFLAGSNDRLQAVCNALFQPCNYTGHYDESLALNREAEKRAISADDFSRAGWRAYQAGWFYRLRAQPREVLACAGRAEIHWHKAQADARLRAIAIRLRGIGYVLADDNS